MNKSKESPPSVLSLAHHCVQALRPRGWALQLLSPHTSAYSSCRIWMRTVS